MTPKQHCDHLIATHGLINAVQVVENDTLYPFDSMYQNFLRASLAYLEGYRTALAITVPILDKLLEGMVDPSEIVHFTGLSTATCAEMLQAYYSLKKVYA